MPGVRSTAGSEGEKIRVVGHDDALFAQGKRQMQFVRRAAQSRLCGCGHIDSAPAQSLSDCGRDVLVEMKPDGHASTRRR